MKFALTVAELINDLRRLPQDLYVYFPNTGTRPRPFVQPVHAAGVVCVTLGESEDGTCIGTCVTPHAGKDSEQVVLLECLP